MDPGETPYDLKWRMFGIPVRVHPLFWLLSVVLGWAFLNAGVEALLIWVACVLVSILVHELGHALTMRYFGLRPRIVLYGMGGLAIPYGHYHSRMEKIVVTLAGPAAGFALFGLVYFSERQFHWADTSKYAAVTFIALYFVNLFWNAINLLPVFPLDGGQLSREVSMSVSRSNGERFAFGLSAAIAIVAAAHAVMAQMGRPLIPGLPVGGWWMALIFGILAYQSIQMFQHVSRRRSFWDNDDRPPWR